MRDIWLRLCGVMLTLGLCLSGARPAWGATNGSAVFSGTATVGKWFATVLDPDGCGKDGYAQPTGRGLYLPFSVTEPPFMNGDDTREDHAVWHIQATGQMTAATSQSGPFTDDASLSTCGYMSPFFDPTPEPEGDRYDGLGAACGASRGHDGLGRIVTGEEEYQLQEFGWPPIIGGTMHLQGRYVEIDEDSGDKQRKVGPATPDDKGSITGWMQFQGGAACLGLKEFFTGISNNGNGAQRFTLLMGLGFHNATMPVGQHGSKCKEPFYPKAPKGPDGKKDHLDKDEGDSVGDCPEKPSMD